MWVFFGPNSHASMAIIESQVVIGPHSEDIKRVAWVLHNCHPGSVRGFEIRKLCYGGAGNRVFCSLAVILRLG